MRLLGLVLIAVVGFLQNFKIHHHSQEGEPAISIHSRVVSSVPIKVGVQVSSLLWRRKNICGALLIGVGFVSRYLRGQGNCLSIRSSCVRRGA